MAPGCIFTTVGRALRRSVLALLLTVTGISWSVAAGNDAPSSGRVVAIAIPEAKTQKVSWQEERSAFAGRLVRSYGLPTTVAEEFAGWILEGATRQRLAPELLASLVMTESSFRKNAASPLGAVGPAQVRVDLWNSFCGGDLFDAEQNLYCGAQILAHLAEVCARNPAVAPELVTACALRSYNVGYHNRNGRYFVDAADRYIAKIDRYAAKINGEPSLSEDT